jgi:LacI family transcriptional regulator
LGIEVPATKRILIAFQIPEALSDILRGISEFAARQHRSWQLLCVADAEFEANFAGRRADGLITFVKKKSYKFIERLVKSQTPVVNLFHNLHPRIPSVLSDDRAIGRTAAEYLISKGFRSFAFASINTPWSIERESGFFDAVQAAGLGRPMKLSTLSVADYCFTTKVRAMPILCDWVRSLPKPTALMAPSDFVAHAIIDAASQRHIRVPEDLAVIGVDNFPTLCELSAVPISSLAQDFVRLGYEAAKLLDQLIEAPTSQVDGPVLVPPGRLHVRTSTDILAFEDPLVVEALNIIHQHASTGIGMKELLRRVPLSRKWLDHRFKQTVGHTPSQEIRRCRIEYVRDLLLQTDMPLRLIAHRCEFSCVENLIRCFRGSHGVSPQAYRQRHRSRT